MQADDELALTTRLCLEAGGVLRIEGTALGTVSVDRTELATVYHPAGDVAQVYFLGPGAVNVSVVRGTQTFTKPVVVRE